MALTDTLTTREAVRRAALEDIVARCELAATSIEGGELDGIKVVSMGVLRDQVSGSLMVDLGPTSVRTAEVSTPATIFTSALCPECGLPVEITVKLTPQLSVDDDGAEIAVKAKSKARAHLHGQLSLSEAEGQASMDEVVIDDLRLRILTAVDDLETELEAATPAGAGQLVTLDAIAVRLELATEHERGDLEESLYRYSQLDVPLVEVVSVTGEPVTYQLTQAGADLVSDAEDDSGDADDPDPDKDDQERIDRDDP